MVVLGGEPAEGRKRRGGQGNSQHAHRKVIQPPGQLHRGIGSLLERKIDGPAEEMKIRVSRAGPGVSIIMIVASVKVLNCRMPRPKIMGTMVMTIRRRSGSLDGKVQTPFDPGLLDVRIIQTSCTTPASKTDMPTTYTWC